jgi:hypothetical protein
LVPFNHRRFLLPIELDNVVAVDRYIAAPHERQRAQYLEDIPGIEARSDIAESARRKILADNARTFYRLAD